MEKFLSLKAIYLSEGAEHVRLRDGVHGPLADDDDDDDALVSVLTNVHRQQQRTGYKPQVTPVLSFFELGNKKTKIKTYYKISQSFPFALFVSSAVALSDYMFP